MKKRKRFSLKSAIVGSIMNWRRVRRRSNSPRWIFAAIAGSYVFAVVVCEAQIQVKAYITDAFITGFNNAPIFNNGRVFIIDTATNQIVGSPISVGFLPAGVTTTPDGRYVYITNNGSDTISVIDTTSSSVVGSINVPTGPLAQLPIPW